MALCTRFYNIVLDQKVLTDEIHVEIYISVLIKILKLGHFGSFETFRMLHTRNQLHKNKNVKQIKINLIFY